jgi:hypothetical protein
MQDAGWIRVRAGVPEILSFLQSGLRRFQFAGDTQDIGAVASRIAADAVFPAFRPTDVLCNLFSEPRPGRGAIQVPRSLHDRLLADSLHERPALVSRI